jgi:hypothetical protein
MGNIQTIQVMAVHKEHRLMWDLRFSGVLLKIPVFWDVNNGHSINDPLRLQPSTHSNFISVSSDYSNGSPINIRW